MSGKHVQGVPGKTRSRDWKFTAEADRHSVDDLKNVLRKFGYPYWIFSEEVGQKNGYHHYQGFLQCGENPVSRKSLTDKTIEFGYVSPKGVQDIHFQPRGKNSVAEAISYCQKDRTHVAGPWSEGTPNLHDKRGHRSDLVILKSAIDNGATFTDLMIGDETSLLMSGNRADWCRRYIQAKADHKAEMELKNQSWSEVTGFYIWGDSGTGKTTWVMKHLSKSIFVASGRDHPFDGYAGQDVILFDEFRLGGALSTEVLLRACDRWHFGLSARYADITPVWTKVVMTSNLSPQEQFEHVPDDQKTALARRIREWHFLEEDRTASPSRLDSLLPLPIAIGDEVGAR